MSSSLIPSNYISSSSNFMSLSSIPSNFTSSSSNFTSPSSIPSNYTSKFRKTRNIYTKKNGLKFFFIHNLKVFIYKKFSVVQDYNSIRLTNREQHVIYYQFYRNLFSIFTLLQHTPYTVLYNKVLLMF